jgi:hypothetical protein
VSKEVYELTCSERGSGSNGGRCRSTSHQLKSNTWVAWRTYVVVVSVVVTKSVTAGAVIVDVTVVLGVKVLKPWHVSMFHECCDSIEREQSMLYVDTATGRYLRC